MAPKKIVELNNQIAKKKSLTNSLLTRFNGLIGMYYFLVVGVDRRWFYCAAM
jgi:hypothetical protein